MFFNLRPLAAMLLVSGVCVAMVGCAEETVDPPPVERTDPGAPVDEPPSTDES